MRIASYQGQCHVYRRCDVGMKAVQCDAGDFVSRTAAVSLVVDNQTPDDCPDGEPSRLAINGYRRRL